MSSQKPSIPKGTRDFTPEEMICRNFIFSSIKEVFRIYGYQPIETPAMENLSTLTGKYGEEGDKLLFKVLNSGDFLSSAGLTDETGAAKEPLLSSKVASKICDRGLRYDLTVPFARFVVQHRNELTFPFKRYQIQPVWRADRPQKGRYREFYQCDVDVIGTRSLLCEVELIQIIDEVFRKLGPAVIIKLNNRKILAGIAEAIGQPEKFLSITIAIDKLDKIGSEGVIKELQDNGLTPDAISKLTPILTLSGSNDEKLKSLKLTLAGSEAGIKGIEEMELILKYMKNTPVSSQVEFDITLARGLNYYTGAIFEVKARDVSIGSICGGGRYDDLTGIFGLPGTSGVGVSFGADRIYDVMKELKLFPDSVSSSTQVLLINFGGTEELYALKIISEIRKAGLSAEIYPESIPVKKQFSYADQKKIPFVVMAGTDEITKGLVTLKDMRTGEQMKHDETLLTEYLQSVLE